MTACTQPACTGTIVDGYCDVCGSPAGAAPFIPAVAAASAASPAGRTGLTAGHGESGFSLRPKNCTQRGCIGTIVDGYCDVCGSPAGAPPFIPAGAAAQQPDVAEQEPATQLIPRVQMTLPPSAQEMAESAAAEPDDRPTQLIPRVQMTQPPSAQEMAESAAADPDDRPTQVIPRVQMTQPPSTREMAESTVVEPDERPTQRIPRVQMTTELPSADVTAEPEVADPSAANTKKVDEEEVDPAAPHQKLPMAQVLPNSLGDMELMIASIRSGTEVVDGEGVGAVGADSEVVDAERADAVVAGSEVVDAERVDAVVAGSEVVGDEQADAVAADSELVEDEQAEAVPTDSEKTDTAPTGPDDPDTVEMPHVGAVVADSELVEGEQVDAVVADSELVEDEQADVVAADSELVEDEQAEAVATDSEKADAAPTGPYDPDTVEMPHVGAVVADSELVEDEQADAGVADSELVEDEQADAGVADSEVVEDEQAEAVLTDSEKTDTAPTGPDDPDTVAMPHVGGVLSGGGDPLPQLPEQQVLAPVPVQDPADKKRFGALALAAAILAALLVGALFFTNRDGGGVTAQSDASVTAPSTMPVSKLPSERSDESRDTGRNESTIQLEDLSDSARPSEAVRIQGMYHGGAGAFLRVQRWEGGEWLDFPLPTKTDDSGRFITQAEFAQPGRYRLRVLDPDSGVTSKTFVVVIED
jgi:hypothetical protein